MNGLVLTMRLVHVLTGVFWAGGVFLMNSFIGPSIAAAGPEGLKVMTELRRRAMHQWLLIIATITILSGLVLVWIDSQGFQPAWFATGMGRGISTGMLAALLAWILGLFFIRPAMEQMTEIGGRIAQAAPEARGALVEQMTAIRTRMIKFSATAALLVLIAVVTMAIARYL